MAVRPITVRIKGFDEVEKAIRRLGDANVVRKVIRATWSAEVRQKVKPTIKRHVRQVFHGKKPLASSYSANVSGTNLYNMRMDVYSMADMAIPHELGPAAPIRAKGGGWLAIPTMFTKGTKLRHIGLKGVQLPRRIRTRLKTQHFKKAEGTFWITSKAGNPVLMQKVSGEGSDIGKAQRKRFGKGKVKKAGSAIPLFTLKKKVTLRKRTRVVGKFKRTLLYSISKRTQKNLVAEFNKVA